jgi:DNA polymerase elongation subunit (family B)
MNKAYENQDKIQVLDRYQWALKIKAHSLYGSLSFAETNSYSPRAGNSVTEIGRWCSTIAMCIESLWDVYQYMETLIVCYSPYHQGK